MGTLKKSSLTQIGLEENEIKHPVIENEANATTYTATPNVGLNCGNHG